MRATAVTTALGAAMLGAMALAQSPEFSFDPQPRWAEEPETEAVCEAVARECPGFAKDGEIDAEWGYAELYDAGGQLVGLRSVRSTGCKPLDEHMLLSQRRFRGAFSRPGESQLDGITVELAPGTRADAVRLVKRGETSIGIGC